MIDTRAAAQFIIVDVGSDWSQTEITHTIKHKGKTIVHKTQIPMFDKKDKNKKDKKADTTTTITGDSPDPTVVGQSYTVSFSVTSTGGTPTGNVTVSDGSVSCSASAADGNCSLTATTAGNKTVKATYDGDGDFKGSTSPGVAHQVNKAKK